MDPTEAELGKLFESLSINRELEPAVTPPFQGYAARPEWWVWWGSYPVHQHQNVNNYLDIVYRNAEGKMHRIYGPAYFSRIYNLEQWYKDGLRHREDGPAYIHNKNKVWFYEDKLHRLDGPAVTELGGPKQYWIHGQRLPPKEYKKEIARRKRKGLIK